MDAFEGFRDNRLDAEQIRPFGGPIARRTRAVLLTGEDNQRRSVGRVLSRSIVDGELLVAWQIARESAFDAGHKRVAQPDVRKRSAHHHLVIAPPSAV